MALGSDITSLSKVSRSARRRMMLIGLGGGLGLTLAAGLLWLVWGGGAHSSADAHAGNPSPPSAGVDASAISTFPAPGDLGAGPAPPPAAGPGSARRTSPGKMAENIIGQSHAAEPRDASAPPPAGGTGPHKRSLAEMATEISGDKAPVSSGSNDSPGNAHDKSAP